PGQEIGDLAEQLRSLKGVKHSTLSMTTTGTDLE
ncbi:nickel-responsive transcriptional regulator NikR, partial [bacterium]|nr:nickel-responsive transcriptional regulator NikR [bacterium]